MAGQKLWKGQKTNKESLQAKPLDFVGVVFLNLWDLDAGIECFGYQHMILHKNTDVFDF